MARRNRGKSNTVSVNMRGVEGRTVLPEGDYEIEVGKVTKEEGQNADYLKWEFVVTDGGMEGKKAYTNTSLSENALWNLKNLLEALGHEVPDDEMELDLDELVGLRCRISIEHESYEGRKQARVVAYEPLDSSDKNEEKDEEKGDRKSSKSKDEEKGGDKGDRKSRSSRVKKVAEADVDEMDEDGLEGLIEEHDLEVDMSSVRTLTKKKGLVLDALEEKGLLAA